MHTIEPGTVAGFGRRLIAYGQSAMAGAAERTYALPGVTLTVACDHGPFLEMCDRALVNDPQYIGGDARSLRVNVIDTKTRPDAPQGRWPADVQSPIPTLHAGLDGSGVDGAFDVDRGVWHFADVAAGQGVQLMKAPDAMPPWEASFPLRDFIHWGLQASGARLVHAATLGINGKGVLIIGQGGAGKSGTTLAGIMSGLESVGDDYVAMSLEQGAVRAFPLMKLVKQDQKGFARVGLDPVAVGAQGPNWQDKYEFDFVSLGRGKRALSLELIAILMPRIAGADRTTFSRGSSRAAMIALAPSNLQQLPGGWREGLAFTANVARRLPAYDMALSADGAEIADAIREFIESHA